MKNVIKIVLVALIGCASMNKVNAQKIAHLDFDSLISIMPQMDSLRKVSNEFVKQLESQLMGMQNELNTKYQEYLTNKDKYTDLIKQTKEKDLNELNQRIQDFQQSAQLEIQKKNEELAKPLHNKARKAIEAVAKEKGYKMVIDTSMDVLLYYEAGDDIFGLVKAKLGVK